MKIIVAVITWLMIIQVPLWADIIILKDGKVFEGEIIKEIVKEGVEQIELKTDYGILTISKSDIKQIAQDIKELLKPADELWQKAKACYERALELKEDPAAKNKELLEGKNFLYEAHQMYDEMRQMFPQGKYVWIDQKKKEMLELMKEFRCARVMVSEAERRKSAYQEKLSELTDNDAEGHYQLALWCEKEVLKEPMLDELAKVIKIAPNHTRAREKLGYIKKEDQWVHKDELPVEKPEPLIEKPEPAPLPPPPPPKPLTFDELMALLKSGAVEEKLKALKKLAQSPEDKTINPLIDEFVKIDQDPEVYEALKPVLLKFNPSKIASSMKRIITSKKKDEISRRARNDALTILSQVNNKEYVKFLTKELLDKAKLLSRGRFKSDEEKIQTYQEVKELTFLIAGSPAKDEAIPLVSKYLRFSTKSALRKAVIRLLEAIRTKKAAETLVNQLMAGHPYKEHEPVINAISAIGKDNLSLVFMPLVKALGNERLKSWSLAVLTTVTHQNFGYDKEKWLDWWTRVEVNQEKKKPTDKKKRRRRE